MEMIQFDPNGNFLFTEEEFNTARSRDKLPLRCLACGETFYKCKNQIQAQLKGDPNIQNKFCTLKCFGASNIVDKTKCNCGTCGKEILVLPRILANSKSGKVFCSKSCAAIYNNAHKTTGSNRSKLEKFLEQELPKIFPDLEIRYNDRELCDGLELDLYIPSLKIAFELNGPIHFQPVFGKTREEKENRFTEVQKKDIMKQRICQEKEIGLYVIDVSRYVHTTDKNNLKYLHYVEECIKENM